MKGWISRLAAASIAMALGSIAAIFCLSVVSAMSSRPVRPARSPVAPAATRYEDMETSHEGVPAFYRARTDDRLVRLQNEIRDLKAELSRQGLTVSPSPE